MKKVVIVGAGRMGYAASRLLSPDRTDFIGFADNDSSKWTLPDGSYSQFQEKRKKPQVFSVDTAVNLAPDEIMISVLDDEQAREIREQVRICRFYGDVVYLKDIYNDFDIRNQCIHGLAGRVSDVKGTIAELGAEEGENAAFLNELMPERKMYLFDLFGGENAEDAILKKMPHPDKCVVRKGHFPECAAGLFNERFAFVSINQDTYDDTLAGLEFFYQKLSRNGIIMVYNYSNPLLEGVKEAVDEYERRLVKAGFEPLKLVPLADLGACCVIIK